MGSLGYVENRNTEHYGFTVLAHDVGSESVRMKLGELCNESASRRKDVRQASMVSSDLSLYGRFRNEV